MFLWWLLLCFCVQKRISLSYPYNLTINTQCSTDGDAGTHKSRCNGLSLEYHNTNTNFMRFQRQMWGNYIAIGWLTCFVTLASQQQLWTRTSFLLLRSQRALARTATFKSVALFLILGTVSNISSSATPLGNQHMTMYCMNCSICFFYFLFVQNKVRNTPFGIKKTL